MADTVLVCTCKTGTLRGVIVLTKVQSNGQLDEKLARLTKKPGVKASIVLDRASGSILKTSGDASVFTTTKSRNATTAATFSNEAGAADESESKGLEDYAAMIWNFVNSSGQLVQDIDTEVGLSM